MARRRTLSEQAWRRFWTWSMMEFPKVLEQEAAKQGAGPTRPRIVAVMLGEARPGPEPGTIDTIEFQAVLRLRATGPEEHRTYVWRWIGQGLGDVQLKDDSGGER